jgi:general secretion pathway protein D
MLKTSKLKKKIMRALLILLILFTNSALAANTFKLENVKINELAKIVYSDILHKNYIVSSDFQQSEAYVSINLTDKTDAQVLEVTNKLLNLNGFSVTNISGNLFISKTVNKEDNLTPYVYKPQFRQSQYLVTLCANLFPAGRFSTERSLPSMNQVDAPTNAPKNSAAALQSSDVDLFIFNGTELEITLLKSLLAQIDVPENQVQITAFLYEVTNSDSSQTSFNLALNVLGKALNLNLAGQVLDNFVSLKGANISAAISALSSDSRFNVMSSPMLTVKDRSHGQFSVGADVPILGSVSYQTNGQPVQSVEYKNSGVLLDFSPLFHADEIELTVHHQLSSFIPTTNGVNNSPTLIKRELSTVVNTKFNDIILLGGLSENRLTKSTDGLPFLPNFLKNRSNATSKSDILLLLQVKKL